MFGRPGGWCQSKWYREREYGADSGPETDEGAQAQTAYRNDRRKWIGIERFRATDLAVFADSWWSLICSAARRGAAGAVQQVNTRPDAAGPARQRPGQGRCLWRPAARCATAGGPPCSGRVKRNRSRDVACNRSTGRRSEAWCGWASGREADKRYPGSQCQSCAFVIPTLRHKPK